MESACLINRLGKLESDFDAQQVLNSTSNPAAECSCCTYYNVIYFKEEEDARLDSDFKKAAGETEADMKVAAQERAKERAKNVEEAAKKAKYEERLKALVLLTQMRDRLRQEEEERKREEARFNTL